MIVIVDENGKEVGPAGRSLIRKFQLPHRVGLD